MNAIADNHVLDDDSYWSASEILTLTMESLNQAERDLQLDPGLGDEMFRLNGLQNRAIPKAILQIMYYQCLFVGGNDIPNVFNMKLVRPSNENEIWYYVFCEPQGIAVLSTIYT